MNYDEAVSVKELAAPVNKVLERLEFVEYLKKQKGGIVTSWKWQPKTGDWVYCKQNNKVVCLYFNEHHGEPPDKYTNPKTAIPILHWEEIERVLEKAGYYLSIFEHTKEGSSWEKESWQVWICAKKEKDRITPKWIAPNLSRQEAVMKTVIELGKEIK